MAMSLFIEPEQEDDYEPTPASLKAEALRHFAHKVRRYLWNRGYYTPELHEDTESILTFAGRVEEEEEEDFVQDGYLDFTSCPAIKYLDNHLIKVNEKKDGTEFFEDKVWFIYAGKTEVPEWADPPEPFDPYELFESGAIEFSAFLTTMMGRTENPGEAGYIMPNGDLLDFSGSRYGNRCGGRVMDHNELEIPDWFVEEAGYDSSKGYAAKMALVDFGAIRSWLRKDELLLDMHTEPTTEQYRRIEQMVGFTSEVRIDCAGKEETGQESFCCGPSMTEVRRRIRGYYNNAQSKVSQFR